MIKILLKALILVCIILSIYFIVNPSACSNLINGRVVNSMETVPVVQDRTHDVSEMFAPVGDRQTKPAKTAETSDKKQNTQEESPYTQEDVDYAVTRLYVELENEYAKEGKNMQDAAKEISYKVMDEFELTPKEWDAFLQRATATNLFDKVRAEYAAEQNKTAAVTDTNSQQADAQAPKGVK